MNLKLKKVVAAVISLIMITVGALSFATVSFSDIEGHWAKDVVVEMAEKGVLNGFDDGTFKPDESVTREQFAKILVETLKLTEKAANIKFVDVEDGRWSKDFIYRASKYLTGYEYNGNYFFRPSDATTREDVVVAVVQAQGLQNEEPDYTLLNQFSDKDEISSELRKYVAIAVKNEIMRGKGGFFDPQGNLTRAEVSQLMYNVFKKVAIGDVKISEIKEVLVKNNWQCFKVTDANANEIDMRSAFGSECFRSPGSLTFKEDGTFTNILPGITSDEIATEGTYTIRDNYLYLKYKNDMISGGRFLVSELDSNSEIVLINDETGYNMHFKIK